MSSTEQARPSSQQQQRVKKPPFADWPTIKILTPPQGQFSPKADEWCISYCYQTVRGRAHGQEPECRSICIRKVFPHEVRNIVSFKNHRSLGPDGKAKYPLPVEGQSKNLPRYLGGKPVDESEGSTSTSSPTPTKYWDEGWYLWASKGRWAAFEKTASMRLDLEKQQIAALQKEKTREIWQDYQDHLKLTKEGQDEDRSSTQTQEDGGKWWGAITPPRPVPETSSQSLLVPLPPDFPPLWERINKLLTPSYQVLGILHDSLTSGEQKQFAQRVWEKAWTDEPFVLAGRTFSGAYERWKNRDAPDEDDGKKGST